MNELQPETQMQTEQNSTLRRAHELWLAVHGALNSRIGRLGLAGSLAISGAALVAESAHAQTINGGENGYGAAFTMDSGNGGESNVTLGDPSNQHYNNAEAFIYLHYSDSQGDSGTIYDNSPFASWPSGVPDLTINIEGLNPPGKCYQILEAVSLGTNSSTSYSTASPIEVGRASGDTCSPPSGSTTTTTSSSSGGGSVGNGNGYWMTAGDGGIFTKNGAPFEGSIGGHPLNRPVVGIAEDRRTAGYWEVATDGGIFSFDAPFHGSTGALRLNMPVVGMAATPDGGGYWLDASDGGIFTFGDAQFHGSTGDIRLNRPMVGMAATPDGGGYWLVAKDGGIFTFGDAGFYGSAAGRIPSGNSAVSMLSSPDGKGYDVIDNNGNVYNFGDAPNYGNPANVANIVGASLLASGGYVEVGSDGSGYVATPTSIQPPERLGLNLVSPVSGVAGYFPATG